MAKQQDYAGMKFGRLLILEKSDVSGKWLAACDCGNKKIINIYHVVSGAVRSCGCLHMERCKTGKNRVIHGDAKKGEVHQLHNKWRAIHGRCYNKTNHAYKDYGGRGIKVCDGWKNNYPAFKKWALSNGYDKKLKLDRKDNNGDYSPENCWFTDSKHQARNRRSSKLITIKGKTQSIASWADEVGIPYMKLYYTLITKPKNKKVHFELVDK